MPTTINMSTANALLKGMDDSTQARGYTTRMSCGSFAVIVDQGLIGSKSAKVFLALPNRHDTDDMAWAIGFDDPTKGVYAYREFHKSADPSKVAKAFESMLKDYTSTGKVGIKTVTDNGVYTHDDHGVMLKCEDCEQPLFYNAAQGEYFHIDSELDGTC